jgi:hypothetical protein
MGWFGRKKPAAAGGAGAAPQAEAPSLVALARRTLAERGVETTIEAQEDDPAQLQLRGADGQVYLLGNLATLVHGEPPATQAEIVGRHFDAMVQGEREPDAEDLTADELREQIRLRIIADRGHDKLDLSYARPFAPGLVLALCLDQPTMVKTLSAGTVAKLPLSVDELFALGQLHTDAEPVEERAEIAPGLFVVEGSSMFTASKAVNLPALFGAAPFGTVFAIPQRHLVLAVPIQADSLQAINTLAGALLQVLSAEAGTPGGVLCRDLLFSRHGEVTVVSDIDPESGTMRIDIDERFQAALEEAGAV